MQPLQRAYLQFDLPGAGEHRTRNNTPGWPAWRPTVNADYGRFAHLPPLELGGALMRRVPYSTQRRIGYWNEKFDRPY